jgi:N-acyl-L-homoserine lactone synthetase
MEHATLNHTKTSESPAGYSVGHPSTIYFALSESRFDARTVNLADLNEASAFQRLRYDYFVGQKRWVCPDPQSPQREIDRYDPFAHHLAVFDGERMVAYLRALPWQQECGFMLDNEFRCLLPDEEEHLVIRQGAAELSRLVIAPEYGNGSVYREGPHVIEVLLKLLYHVSLDQRMEHFYVVVEESWLRPFARRFNMRFAPLGETHTFADGTRTMAAHSSLAQLEAAVRQESVEKLRWYQERRTASRR